MNSLDSHVARVDLGVAYHTQNIHTYTHFYVYMHMHMVAGHAVLKEGDGTEKGMHFVQ